MANNTTNAVRHQKGVELEEKWINGKPPLGLVAVGAVAVTCGCGGRNAHRRSLYGVGRCTGHAGASAVYAKRGTEGKV